MVGLYWECQLVDESPSSALAASAPEFCDDWACTLISSCGTYTREAGAVAESATTQPASSLPSAFSACFSVSPAVMPSKLAVVALSLSPYVVTVMGSSLVP